MGKVIGRRIEYSDGCEFAKSCLNCPFPDDCIFTKSRGIQSERMRLKDKEIKRLFDAGESKKALAERFSVNIRTIHRALRRRLK